MADAVAKLGQYGDAKFLAGGQTLLASLKLRLAQPECLVDLRHIEELTGISVVSGASVRIGAMTTHASVAESADIAKTLASLVDMANHIGDPMVRQMGTIGGSIANNDPAADWPAALLALDAVVTTSTRTVKADDFFLGMFTTALDTNELVTAVEFKVPSRSAYVKFRHPASRFALVGVYVADFAGKVRVAVTGAGSGAVRLPEFEAALDKNFSAAALDGIEVDASDLNADMHASAEYRANLVGVITKRAVEKALAASGNH